MKKQITPILLGLLLLGTVFPGSTFAQEYFDINQYDVTMNVQENHAYDIQENITVTLNRSTSCQRMPASGRTGVPSYMIVAMPASNGP